MPIIIIIIIIVVVSWSVAVSRSKLLCNNRKYIWTSEARSYHVLLLFSIFSLTDSKDDKNDDDDDDDEVL